MDGLGENVPVIGFLHGSVNIPGTIKAFIRDLHGLPGNLIPVLHFLNERPDIRFFRFVSGKHLHGHRNQIRVKEKCLPDDGVMPFLFGRAFLLISTGQIDLEIIIRTIKKYMAEISRVILLIAMVNANFAKKLH